MAQSLSLSRINGNSKPREPSHPIHALLDSDLPRAPGSHRGLSKEELLAQSTRDQQHGGRIKSNPLVYVKSAVPAIRAAW